MEEVLNVAAGFGLTVSVNVFAETFRLQPGVAGVVTEIVPGVNV